MARMKPMTNRAVTELWCCEINFFPKSCSTCCTASIANRSLRYCRTIQRDNSNSTMVPIADTNNIMRTVMGMSWPYNKSVGASLVMLLIPKKNAGCNKSKMRKNHHVVKCLKENVNFSNWLVIKFCSMVKGIMPHAWQRLTNGRSCSKIDILIWRTQFLAVHLGVKLIDK